MIGANKTTAATGAAPNLQHVGPLLESFLHEVIALDVQLLEGCLQVADPTVNELRRSSGSAVRERRKRDKRGTWNARGAVVCAEMDRGRPGGLGLKGARILVHES